MFMYSHKVTVELLIGGKMVKWAHLVHLPRKGVGDAHSRLIALSPSELECQCFTANEK